MDTSFVYLELSHISYPSSNSLVLCTVMWYCTKKRCVLPFTHAVLLCTQCGIAYVSLFRLQLREILNHTTRRSDEQAGMACSVSATHFTVSVISIQTGDTAISDLKAQM